MAQSGQHQISIPPPAKCASESSSPTDSVFIESEKAFLGNMPDPEKQQVSMDPEKTLGRTASSGFRDLEAQTEPEPKRRWYAPIRYTALDIYRRLFSIVFLANLGVFIWVMVANRTLMALINATAANVLACGLARQPLVVNTFFRVACSIPRSAPLRLRQIACKVYHYGGVHSGCGVASFVWYIGFVAVLTRTYTNPPGGQAVISSAPVILAYIILVLLMAIIIVAYPGFRAKLHDYFELTHRFSGWVVVALFLCLLLVFADEARRAEGVSLGSFIIKIPGFWFLMIVIASIIHPWVFLRKVRVEPEYLSDHAVRLHFDYTKTAFGKGIQLSKHPLRDWHGFATFPDPGGNTFSSMVSKAGDWTADTIKEQPTHLWKRGVLVYGFAYSMRVFKKVLVVTTGSGIGPCLSFLGDENRPELRVVWQTRAPVKTYGEKVIDLVKQMDPDPVIVDTNERGRIDMVPLIRKLYKEFEPEAVCVISNGKVTKNTVYELEATGIKAYGPIFDS
ncbi:integral membrane protein TmpA [Aspergillus ruber CBS 135680]|uniref:Integral membrane protein TmpA n=1 Tax=Aspergillus ruber (strain CBS 135680) TaxID=1388766 RepID=A0A017SB13_ASPRC|nr:integral membrane protein TmpA [Aspergillus ruber CBS 135680]EYE94107.1 integral membrane protein TmpA [Aspergillus ruber CBS 135680]